MSRTQTGSSATNRWFFLDIDILEDCKYEWWADLVCRVVWNSGCVDSRVQEHRNSKSERSFRSSTKFCQRYGGLPIWTICTSAYNIQSVFLNSMIASQRQIVQLCRTTQYIMRFGVTSCAELRYAVILGKECKSLTRKKSLMLNNHCPYNLFNVCCWRTSKSILSRTTLSLGNGNCRD